MANTYAGRQLTEQHRKRQLALRAATLRDLLRIFPAFDVDDIDGSWPAVEAALATLIAARRRDSSQLAANYYRAFRTIEGLPGDADLRLAPPPDEVMVAATLRLLGPIQAKKNVAARVPNVAARTLTRLSGSVARQVLDGGRQTLSESVKADPRGLGWRRVTDADPCDFCADIAAEGIQSEGGGFAAHDHCGCTAEPAFA